ncbi:MAG: bifunctional adenosylcobinamide kinase/adenosylcobinamide-phosphate guanylyltransferase [Pseudomonadales bacterium]
MKELILGGARSGKSKLAEQAAEASGLRKVYIATAQAGDAEMEQRIELHRQRRGASWQLIEEPVDLAKVLKEAAREDTCILVDCLTLWLSNCLFCGDDSEWPRQRAALLEMLLLLQLPGHVIFVSNEISMGVIPMGEVTRQFVDEVGLLHQALAEICNRVTLSVAGLPHVLKS